MTLRSMLAAALCAAISLPAAAGSGSDSGLGTGSELESGTGSSRGEDWWTADIWSDPDRPFLYYGSGPEESLNAERQALPPRKADPEALPDFATMAEVRAEYSARLDRAVMHPTDDNLRALHALQTYIFSQSHRFSQAYDRVRAANPKFDWTAAHPSANFAAVELSSAAESGTDTFIRRLAADSGLIFAGGSSAEMNALAIGPVRALAREMGFELLALETSAPIPGDGVKPDNGTAALLGLDPQALELPTVMLVPRPGAAHPAIAALSGRPMRLAAGVQSLSELKRRFTLFFAPDIAPGNATELPGRLGTRLAAERADWPPEWQDALRARFAASDPRTASRPDPRPAWRTP